MDKLSEDKNPIEQPGIYKPPTHEQVVDSMTSKGPFYGRCKLCKQNIKVSYLEELQHHKCNG